MAKNKPSSRRILSRVEISDTKLLFTAVLCIAIAILLALTAFYGIIMLIVSPPTLSFPTFNLGSENDGASYPFRQDITVNMSYDDTKAEPIKGIDANNAVLVDITTGEIVAQKLGKSEINPASMTKVMTLIVVMENLKSTDALNDMVPVTATHISHKTSERKLSGDLGSDEYPAGNYSVKTLLNHLIMDSSGVAALALADYIAGSEANFVKLMNEKADELELERTVFVYCDGSHALGHKSTVRDIAKIMAYAMKNTHCASILSAHRYTDENGNTIYHKPLVHNYYQENGKIPEIKSTTSQIIAAKSGWTGSFAQGWSGGCMVTFANGNNGHKYIVVVAGTSGSNFTYEAAPKAVADSIKILDNYIK